MPNKILANLPLDFDLGFKLTGIDTQGCASDEKIKECLEKELLQQRYNLILIDEQSLLYLDNRLRKKIQDTTMPLVMTIPLKKSFKKEIEPRDYFLKMVQDAIGYEIRIK